MSESVIKKTITREICTARWGQKTCLADEDNFSIQEYTVNSKDTLRIHINDENVYFILASGSAEFNFNEDKKIYFKGEKIEIFSKNQAQDIIITNFGVIPLVLIKVGLK
jgi:mannose-6-phosphate isomerase-like protein (cupin superfamily)